MKKAPVFIFLFVMFQALAAQNVRPGYLNVKFNRSTADYLRARSDVGQKATTYYKTGRQNLDTINQTIRAYSYTPVFRTDPRYAERHRKHDLDLYFEVAYRADLLPQDVIQQFLADGSVILAEPVFWATSEASDSLPNDMEFSGQWGLFNRRSSYKGIDINAIAAWKKTSGDPRVIVAIIDDCVDRAHPELFEQSWNNPGEIMGNGKDDDKNGYVDDYFGWNFRDQNDDVLPKNSQESHGTHVAGIVGAATNNAIGVAGVAGGWGSEKAGTTLMVFRCGYVNEAGTGVVAYGYQAMVYAADNGAAIAQCSWGSTSQTSVGTDAINYFTEFGGGEVMKGGLVIAAAGNSSTDSYHYPSASRHVLSVGSIQDNGDRSDFSNYGKWVLICAPGSNILSTIPFRNYGTKSGTSMACPMVSGVAALVLAATIDVPKNLKTPQWLVDILTLSGKREYEALLIGPLVDASRAIDRAIQSTAPNAPRSETQNIQLDYNAQRQTLSLRKINNQPFNYRIFDVLGRQVQAGTATENTEIYVGKLRQTTHVIHIQQGNHVGTATFVKHP